MKGESTDTFTILSRQGHRLLQIGVAFLLVTSFEGFAIPHFAAPHLGRSVHTLIALLSVLLLTLGLAWPKLNLGAATSRIAFWLLIYSGVAIVSAFQEAVIKAVAYSSGPTGIISFALILWGLRSMDARSRKE